MKLNALLSGLLSLALLPAANSYSAEWLYTFRPGDNIWDLCLKYTNQRGCWQKLPKINGVTQARQLRPGFVLSFPVDWLKETPKPVTVEFISGQVMAKRSDSTPASALSVGEQLPIGSIISTADGNVNLRFGDGSTMQLEPNSELALDALSTVDGYGIVDSRLRLNQGAVKTRVVKRTPASRYTITTPTAVAAVRGTEYRVSSIIGEQPLMRGEVFEGLVDVSANSSVEPVAAGFGITAQKDVPLAKPKPLLPRPTFLSSTIPQLLPTSVDWQALDGAMSYQLELLQDNDLEELIERLSLTDTRHPVTALDVGCYRLRLRGIDSDELQGLGAQHRLCIAAPLAVPQLDPKQLNYNGRFEAKLMWPAIEEAAQYRVQIASDDQFAQILSDDVLKADAAPHIQVSGQEPRYIRVQVIGNEGQITVFSQPLEWKPKPSPWIAIGMYTLFALIAL